MLAICVALQNMMYRLRKASHTCYSLPASGRLYRKRIGIRRAPACLNQRLLRLLLLNCLALICPLCPTMVCVGDTTSGRMLIVEESGILALQRVKSQHPLYIDTKLNIKQILAWRFLSSLLFVIGIERYLWRTSTS